MAGMKVWYDREGDFLEVTFEDMPAVMEEIQEDMFERRTPDGRVVGFAIFNFGKYDRDRLTFPLEVVVTPTE